jgi:hypothetical protein
MERFIENSLVETEKKNNSGNAMLFSSFRARFFWQVFEGFWPNRAALHDNFADIYISAGLE